MKHSLAKKQSGSMNALKVLLSIISISLIGRSKKVVAPSLYLVELSKMERVAGTSLTGHTGHLMLLSTQSNYLMELIVISLMMKT